MKHHGRIQFLRATALFAEAFARTLPLVFGPFIVQRITSHNWHNAGELLLHEPRGWAGARIT